MSTATLPDRWIPAVAGMTKGPEMKIRDIKTYVLEAALTEPFAYSQAWYERRGACLVEIVGEDGNSGWGEAFGPPRLTAPIVEFYKPLLIGADALATEAIWESLYNRLRDHGQKGLAIEALSAVDIALWDLKARHLGLPVHRLLGGPLRTSVAAYATGFYRKRNGEPLKYLVEEAHQRVAEGFGAIKLKLGFGLDEDVRLCEAVRRAIGDGMAIMVDANHAFMQPRRSISAGGSRRSTLPGSKSRCRPKTSPDTARSRPRSRSRSPAARPSSPAGAFGRL